MRTERREATLIPGGARERAIIFREALAAGRTVSVGYRPGGMLEVRDLTGWTIWLVEYTAPTVMS